MKRISISEAAPGTAGVGWPLRVASFDPALPVDGSLIVANELRGQFNGLKALIDAIVSVDAAVVDGVSTLPAGDPAQASVAVVANVLRFSFGIPKGYRGEQGPPGEVTVEELNNAIQQTSANSNAVTPLGMVVSDPPTQAEVQAIANQVDELIAALRR